MMNRFTKSILNRKNFTAEETAAIYEVAKRLATKPTAAPMCTATNATTTALAYLLNETREHFAVMFLDNQFGLIEYKTLFMGTLDRTTVHPQEVAREALALNAKAIILTHNHPSGSLEISSSDKQMTNQIVEVLKLIDVSVLDHIIVANGRTTSFAARGLL